MEDEDIRKAVDEKYGPRIAKQIQEIIAQIRSEYNVFGIKVSVEYVDIAGNGNMELRTELSPDARSKRTGRSPSNQKGDVTSDSNPPLKEGRGAAPEFDVDQVLSEILSNRDNGEEG